MTLSKPHGTCSRSSGFRFKHGPFSDDAVHQLLGLNQLSGDGMTNCTSEENNFKVSFTFHVFQNGSFDEMTHTSARTIFLLFA